MIVLEKKDLSDKKFWLKLNLKKFSGMQLLVQNPKREWLQLECVCDVIKNIREKPPLDVLWFFIPFER